MTRYALCLAALCLAALPVRAQDDKKPAPKTLLDTWQAAYLEGLKVGHGHIRAVEITKDGQKVIRSTRTLDFVLKRYNSVLPIRMEHVCEEDADGKVLTLQESLAVAKDKKPPVRGVVKGDKIQVTAGDDVTRELDFPAAAVGPYHQHTLFARKKVKAGDSFKVASFELSLLSPITSAVTVKGAETVDRLVPKKDGDNVKVVREKVKLTRVEVKPGKVKLGDMELQLPAQTLWLDAKLAPVRESFELPGAGVITLYSTTKDAAMEKGVAPELLPDLGLNVSIPLEQTIEKPYETREVVYRVTTAEPLENVFSSDDRQKVRERKEKSFELVVKAVRAPAEDQGGKKPGDDYLESNHFINSDNAQVKALAKKAVGGEKDPWKKAQAIEKWVHDNMKVSTATGFPTAAQIAKDLEGDCRQHALLVAAMCRAAGVPSRTAIGLVYVREEGRTPLLGFHMWAEVWVRGKWVGLDAILGKGGIAATHLKMGDHSWAKTVTLAPLLPVARTLGKLKVEVVSSK